MWKNWLRGNKPSIDYRTEDYGALLRYINNLANHKLGYPVSLLTYLGILDNRKLGIKPGTLANVLLNNVGDPFKDSETSLLEVKRHEREVISMFENFYGLHKSEARGYVTTGGTEGNFAGLWWSKRYLINKSLSRIIATDSDIKRKQKEEQELTVKLSKISLSDHESRASCLTDILKMKEHINAQKALIQQIVKPTIFYTKGHTHYSVPKISEILNLTTKPVASNEDGSMDLNDFRRQLIFHMGAHPESPIAIIANIGTTVTGAIDNVPEIKRIVDQLDPKPIYTIHMDGALTGFVLPIIKPFPGVTNYFDELGVNTLAVSAHKYPGLSQPCGIILATKNFFDCAFENSERSVEYVGNIVDSTITGSRSGLNVLMLFNALKMFQLDKDNAKLKEMVQENLDNAKYLYDELVKLYGEDKVRYPYHFNVIFPRPSQAIAKKYQLMLTGDNATICVLSNAHRKLINEFIRDLKKDKENSMTTIRTETEYSVHTLTDEYLATTTELFVKTFCDHEPITQHIGMTYEEYEPFVKDVLTKAIKDGLSVVAIDKHNKAIACTIAEDIADRFEPNIHLYPKMMPIIALLDKLSAKFYDDKEFKPGMIAHVWVAAVSSAHRGVGLSTAIDKACGILAVKKGYKFAYAEFTNPISENIIHHYKAIDKIGSITYDTFTYSGQRPFKGVKGETISYVIGFPGTTMDELPGCYTTIKS